MDDVKKNKSPQDSRSQAQFSCPSAV